MASTALIEGSGGDSKPGSQQGFPAVFGADMAAAAPDSEVSESAGGRQATAPVHAGSPSPPTHRHARSGASVVDFSCIHADHKLVGAVAR